MRANTSPTSSRRGCPQAPLFVPALSVDAWRFPSLLGPPDRLRARFAPDALPHGRDLDALLAASEVAGTLLAPSGAPS